MEEQDFGLSIVKEILDKNNGKIKILEEFNSIQDGHKIKSISEIILKKELNENQKQKGYLL